MKATGLFVFLFLSCGSSLAFVENVTHGYQNCMACHLSPAGGGILNDYGRSLSKELMSTWGWRGSEEPLFGAFKNGERLKIGGDFRTLQTYLENAEIKQGRRFVMQKNIEVAAAWGTTWFIGTLGTQEGPDGTPGKGRFLSERHFLLWNVTDDVHLRLGKFRLNFGLSDPQHARATKAPLGFGALSETYQLEFSKFSETDEIFISASLGRLDLPRAPQNERSLSATYSRFLGSDAKAGASALFGESASQRRSLIDTFAIFPWSKHAIVKVETALQRSTGVTTPDQSRDLFAGTLSVGYRAAKGLLPYLIHESLQQDLSDPRSKQSSLGVGFQWLPLPHLEVAAEYQRQVLASRPGRPNDFAWLMFHFSL